MPARERILLVQLKRIGDFILTAPAIAALRAAKPDAEIVAIVPANVAELARCIPALDRILTYRQSKPNARTWLSAAAGSWDACFDFTGTDRSAFITRLSRAQVRAGYQKFADKKTKAAAYTTLCDASVRDLHTIDFHLALTGQPATTAPAFTLPEQLKHWRKTSGITTRYAVVHPGTARAEKLWPPARWAAVIEHLVHAAGLQVIITGSDDSIERPHLAELRGALKTPVTDLSGKLSVIETAAIIEGSQLALGVDSMAMHLAAMFQRPQIVLFGPTNPFHWRPRHDRALVLGAGHPEPMTRFDPRARGAEMNLISTAQVMDAIASLRQRLD